MDYFNHFVSKTGRRDFLWYGLFVLLLFLIVTSFLLRSFILISFSFLVAQNSIIVAWFADKEMALAMGLSVSAGRLVCFLPSSYTPFYLIIY